MHGREGYRICAQLDVLLAERVISPGEVKALLIKLAKIKRLDFRWLRAEEIERFRDLFEFLYNSKLLSTTEIARMVGKSQLFAWSMCRRLGVNLRSRDVGGRLYAPKRTPNARRPFDGSDLDRAYLKGFAHGDLDVRRTSTLAITASSTTTHPAFVALFESLFRSYGPVYVYPILDRVSGYRWKVAARLDNTFAFILPEQRMPYPDYSSNGVFFAWLAGLVDSDGSVGIIHAANNVRVNLGIANEDLMLLRHIREQLLRAGYSDRTIQGGIQRPSHPETEHQIQQRHVQSAPPAVQRGQEDITALESETL